MIDSGERLSLVAGERRSIEPPALRIVYTRGVEGRGSSPCPKFFCQILRGLYIGWGSLGINSNNEIQGIPYGNNVARWLN